MKIVVIGTRGFPDVQGGVEVHCQNLYSCLAEAGCDVTVLARRTYVGREPYMYRGVKLVPLFSIRHKHLESFLHTLLAVFIARRHKPDVLHIHSIGPGFFVPLARLLGLRVVLTTHGENYRHLKWGPLAKIFLRCCECLGVSFADKVIAVSWHSAHENARKYGKMPAVIPNGVSLKGPLEPGEKLRVNQLKPGRYFLAVGRLVPEKGVHDLLEAYSRVKGLDWRLVIVGDSDHDDQYSRDLKEKAARTPGVVLTGFLTGDPLREVFCNAGVFVLPSYYEGAPIALLEAMGYGLNCLVSDIAATREIALPEKNYFKPGAVAVLVEKLKEIAACPWSAQERSVQTEYVLKQYDWAFIARRTLGVYKMAVERKAVDPSTLRVVHFYASDLNGVAEGGIASYVKELLKHSHDGVRHSFVGVTRAMKHSLGCWGRLSFEGNTADFFPILSVDHQHVTYEKGVPLNARFLWSLFFHRRMIQCSADVLHFHRVELALPFVIFKKKGVPVVLTIHGSSKHHELAKDHGLFSKGWFNWFYLNMEAFVMNRVDKVILVNAEGVEYYTKKFSAIADRFQFLPTFTDLAKFCPMDRLTCRKIFGIDPKARVFLFVGRLHEQKGLDLLVDAFLLRKHNRGDGFLVIAGDGGERERLQQRFVDAGITDVLFLGNVAHEKLPALFNAANVFVLPSLWEGMPIVLLEALACGVPAVATDVGQIAMVIQDGVNGSIVRRRDPVEMESAMARVVGRSLEMSALCRSSANEFSSDKVITDIECLYRTLV